MEVRLESNPEPQDRQSSRNTVRIRSRRLFGREQFSVPSGSFFLSPSSVLPALRKRFLRL